MTKVRLDVALVKGGKVNTRSSAENLIKLGYVCVNGKKITKPGLLISQSDLIKITAKETYVSRGAYKLLSVIRNFDISFNNKTVLDVGSSTGGFSEVALKLGAKKVIAVERGTNQMDSALATNDRIELHENTDINDIQINKEIIDIVLIDVSFVSVRDILVNLRKKISSYAQIIVLVKPQFEASTIKDKHKGVIKNEKVRRQILKSFEEWAKYYFIIINKKDSEVSGAKGNNERFYHLKPLSRK